MSNRERAISILKNYFKEVMKIWSYDNDADIEELVDCLIAAAREGQ